MVEEDVNHERDNKKKKNTFDEIDRLIHRQSSPDDKEHVFSENKDAASQAKENDDNDLNPQFSEEGDKKEFHKSEDSVFKEERSSLSLRSSSPDEVNQSFEQTSTNNESTKSRILFESDDIKIIELSSKDDHGNERKTCQIVNKKTGEIVKQLDTLSEENKKHVIENARPALLNQIVETEKTNQDDSSFSEVEEADAETFLTDDSDEVSKKQESFISGSSDEQVPQSIQAIIDSASREVGKRRSETQSDSSSDNESDSLLQSFVPFSSPEEGASQPQGADQTFTEIEEKKAPQVFQPAEENEIEAYVLNEPFAYARIRVNPDTYEKKYIVMEPSLSDEEREELDFIKNTLVKGLNINIDEIEEKGTREYLLDQIVKISDDYSLDLSSDSLDKIFYYIERDALGFGKIDPLMKDPHIEDISCDGPGIPVFLYHRKHGSLRTNVVFENEDELSSFVIKLAQKCGKHISIAEPMLDATMPDGSRIQLTLSTEVTTKGSTFTIRKFKADPFTPTDLVEFHTLSPEMVAYMWLAVENGASALFAGGTASGKTTTMNALALFIPPDSKVVSIEETREINLPHSNWIPGVARSGFGEVVGNRMVGEIDMYDLMKAALRQRPEYILVGEIRGKEAYVLFQAMATGHTTYSTVHADSPQALIHRLEGKPLEVPRIMVQSLDIVLIHGAVKVAGKRERRCKQIVEIVGIDGKTKEILTNEVFRWNPQTDDFDFSGKSYVLERIRGNLGLSKKEMNEEFDRRADIVEWMKNTGVNSYKKFARIVSRYYEDPKNVVYDMKSDTDVFQQLS